MTNRTTFLLIGAGLSLALGSLPSTLQAQQPPPFGPAGYRSPPILPPNYREPRRPAWVEFLKDNDFLAPYIVAAVLFIPIAILVGIVRGLIHLLRPGRDRDSGDGPRAPPFGNGGT
jgi:hypothetical protein